MPGEPSELAQVFCRGRSSWRSKRIDCLSAFESTSQDLVVLDDSLVERARFALPSEWRASSGVTPDLRFAAISE